TVGHIKVVTDGRGNIRGATIVGAGAGELITTWTLAIDRGLPIRALAGIIVPYPTLAEIGKRAAITYFTPSLTNVWVRRIIALLRRFGGAGAKGSMDMTDRPATADQSSRARARMGLSAKLLVLTLSFVMIAEVLIYVPSVANFRLNW